MGNKWRFNNKKCFCYYWVVLVTAGVALKSWMANLRALNLLISEHIKNKDIKNLFSKLGFYKMTFKSSMGKCGGQTKTTKREIRDFMIWEL